MKRALAAALTAAIFMTLLAGMASAEVSVGDESVAVRTQDSDQVHDFSIRRLLIKCYRVIHSDDADPALKQRCEKILKRWCASHPDSRVCHRPPPPPHCRPIDRVTDARGVVTDRITDVKCVPIDRPIDKPTDRPTDKPSDRPSDRPTDKPQVNDGIQTDTTDRLTDKANDAYVQADSADL